MSKKRRAALLLAPGAGADANQSTLVALDDALTKMGIVVRRMDFPYRKAGRKAPDREPVLIEAIVDEIQTFKKQKRLGSLPLVLGGRSMGGRMMSIAAATVVDADALTLISYPLHPPGKPDRLRTDHFSQLDMPSLFISGTKDAFGTQTEFRRAFRKIPGVVEQVWIDGGDHGLRRHDETVVSAVTSFIDRYFD